VSEDKHEEHKSIIGSVQPGLGLADEFTNTPVRAAVAREAGKSVAPASRGGIGMRGNGLEQPNGRGNILNEASPY